MKNKVLRIFLTLILLISSITFLNNKVYAEEFPYSDAIVENFAAAMTSEIGCGHPEDPSHFVYQLMWSAILVNNHYYDHEHNNITATTLCQTLKKHYTPNGDYCDYTFAKLYVKRPGSQCPQKEQEEQAKAAARLVLARSFNIPSNIIGASEESVVNAYGTVWFRFQTESWADIGYYWYPNNQSLSTKDVYGNTVSQDVNFYKSLATCLHSNKTLYYAYNKCPNGTETSTSSYYVLLYPNGGTGITEGQKFEYNGITSFSSFPTVTKTNCTLDGWNVGSPTGKEYYQNVDATDNGQKLYARWICNNETKDTYTVVYKLNDGTDNIYKTEKVKANETVTYQEQPTRSGYKFYGWVDEKGSLYNYTTPITKNITLYAQWVVTNGNETNKENNKEVANNPQTSSRISLIIAIIALLSFFGVTYYNKYYQENNDNIN